MSGFASLREIVLARGGHSESMTVDGMEAVLRAYDVAEEVIERRRWFEAERQRRIKELLKGKAERLRKEGERALRGGRRG